MPMFYPNKRPLIELVILCAFQVFIINAMEPQPETRDLKLVPNFSGSLSVEGMTKALINKQYPALKRDLYKKIELKVHGTMEWVKYRLDFNKHPDTAYDPFLLYFVVRQGYLDITTPNTNVFLIDLYMCYRAFFSLAIVTFANTYAGIRLGYPEESIKIYNFLMDKICNYWIGTFSEYFSPRLELYLYETRSNKEPEDVIQALKKVIIIDGDKKSVNPQFLDCLRSPEWIACSRCGEDNYFYKGTIDFGEPSAELSQECAKNTALIKQAHEESILKIMEVFDKLQGTTAEKAMAFAKLKFKQVWQS